MPFYTFTCPDHGDQERLLSIKHCKQAQMCAKCHGFMERNFLADLRTITTVTTSCRDHSEIPHQKRVVPHHGHVSKEAAERLERAYGKHIQEQRKAVKRTGRFRKTHSVPAEAFFGKVKETGDRRYWDDPVNVSHHKEFEL